MSDKRALRRSEKIKRLYERHRRIHKLLRKYGNDIIHSDNFRKTKRHIQHGNMTVNDHCLSVARHSLILDKKLGLHCNRRDLIRGSLLHDYFLYDWHDKGYVPERGRLHGFTHPNTALRNAAKEYELTDICCPNFAHAMIVCSTAARCSHVCAAPAISYPLSISSCNFGGFDNSALTISGSSSVRAAE
mgnify:CR=1 FL=1